VDWIWHDGGVCPLKTGEYVEVELFNQDWEYFGLARVIVGVEGVYGNVLVEGRDDSSWTWDARGDSSILFVRRYRRPKGREGLESSVGVRQPTDALADVLG
jgi:hypothetical protein